MEESEWPADSFNVVQRETPEEENLRLRRRVAELEEVLTQKVWSVSDFYTTPSAAGVPPVYGQIFAVGADGEPESVIEAAAPDLMASLPSFRELLNGLPTNVVRAKKPHWWPL